VNASLAVFSFRLTAPSLLCSYLIVNQLSWQLALFLRY
jgi:hypothetical protein